METSMLALLLFVMTYATGQHTHQVIVTFHSYSNPSGRCAECNGAIPTAPACCDAPFPVPQDQSCPVDDTCDTALVYCYRALGATGSICSQPNSAPNVLLDVNTLSNSSQEFFGLSNPFIQDRFGSWQGRQILLVFSECFSTPTTCEVNSNLIIDSVPLNIDLPVGTSVSRVCYEGMAGIAHVTASIEVMCAADFFGADCFTPCSNFESCAGCGLSGFTGQFCQFSIDECSDAYCNGRGNCTEGYSHCDCDSGFTGDRCEINIDDCGGVECNNGSCVDETNNFRCECNPGFTGDRCEIDVDECKGASCDNGACIEGFGYFRCDCYPGFTGELCEINIDDCETVRCDSGLECVDEVNGFKCCVPGSNGEECEDTSSTTIASGASVTANIAGGVVGAGIGITLTVVILVTALVKYRKSQQYLAFTGHELGTGEIAGPGLNNLKEESKSANEGAEQKPQLGQSAELKFEACGDIVKQEGSNEEKQVPGLFLKESKVPDLKITGPTGSNPNPSINVKNLDLGDDKSLPEGHSSTPVYVSVKEKEFNNPLYDDDENQLTVSEHLYSVPKSPHFYDKVTHL